jgi:hypothetical protein
MENFFPNFIKNKLALGFLTSSVLFLGLIGSTAISDSPIKSPNNSDLVAKTTEKGKFTDNHEPSPVSHKTFRNQESSKFDDSSSAVNTTINFQNASGSSSDRPPKNQNSAQPKEVTQEILEGRKGDFHRDQEVKIIYNPHKSTKQPSIKSVKNSAGQSTVSPAIPNTVSPMVGFASSSVQPDQADVKINEPITFTFEVVPSREILDSLRFYPDLEFDKQLHGNVLTVFPKNMKRNTTYTFGLYHSSACPPTEDTNCQNKREWSYAHTFRSSYKETRVYGKSVEGRDLVAHFFGNSDENGTKIMLTGGIHGEEWRAGDLSRLVDYLNNNPQEIIHQNKSFVIVPFTNPDSSRIERRYNSNGVNLNRNWPAYWEPGYNRGPYPLSEPEVKHLYDLTLAEMPDYLISYHSQWPPYGIIFPGDEKIPATMDFAYWVANKTGYPVGLYPYEAIVAGDQTVWAETVGIRSLIIEATCKQCYDWEQNFPLYLAMLREL